MTDDAAFDVMRQKLHTQTIEGAPCGGDLVEDFEAVAVFVDHLADTTDLTTDAVDAGFNFLGFFCCHDGIPGQRNPVRVYTEKAQGQFGYFSFLSIATRDEDFQIGLSPKRRSGAAPPKLAPTAAARPSA